MDFLEKLGIVGFCFFAIKGILWLVVFFLIYKGILTKEAVKSFKSKAFSRLKNLFYRA